MKEISDISKIFNSTLFWDVDISGLDMEKSNRLIIERVFSLGTMEEVKAVLGYYGSDRIINTLANLNYLDPKTLNFVSVLFDKPQNEFRCYLRKQSGPQLWNS